MHSNLNNYKEWRLQLLMNWNNQSNLRETIEVGYCRRISTCIRRCSRSHCLCYTKRRKKELQLMRFWNR